MKTDLQKRMLEAMYDGRLPDVRLNPDGSEVLDPTPMAPPIGYKRQPSMVEIVRDMVRSQRLADEVSRSGHETFEEADDFDVDDDYDPTSPYENDFEPPVRELVRRRDEDLTKGSDDVMMSSSNDGDDDVRGNLGVSAAGVSDTKSGNGDSKSGAKSRKKASEPDDGGDNS